jgi:hypothetical protein
VGYGSRNPSTTKPGRRHGTPGGADGRSFSRKRTAADSGTKTRPASSKKENQTRGGSSRKKTERSWWRRTFWRSKNTGAKSGTTPQRKTQQEENPAAVVAARCGSRWTTSPSARGTLAREKTPDRENLARGGAGTWHGAAALLRETRKPRTENGEPPTARCSGKTKETGTRAVAAQIGRTRSRRRGKT